MFDEAVDAAGHRELHTLAKAALGGVEPLCQTVPAGGDQRGIGQLRVQCWR